MTAEAKANEAISDGAVIEGTMPNESGTKVADEPWAREAEALTEKLARYRGPEFRRAYLAVLLSSGQRLHAAGNGRVGDYCFNKVIQALDNSPGQALERESPSGSGTEYSSAAASEAESGSPLEVVRHNWRKERFKGVEAVLRQQSRRLSALEQQSYREKLDGLKVVTENARSPLQAAKVDGKFSDLRRKLYSRILKAQKVALGKTSGQLTVLPDFQASEKSSALEFIVGPYNDRYNLADVLTLIGKADAAWIEDFLDLYRGLGSLKVLNSPGSH